ncbi:DUF4309 domain-containing protein [Paenibacillus qinlingensis]|uniref:Uncharacterized protein n=1 Tax=Paenibacillus qinlingensis TaxID=1837343 RepID=A0ABU1NR85_9BACL|nr:DUF4309 domain-containing protein [Paenibacillus qinlingensis]MDR6549993.1 hypothetical protein [Paenibacillus qinlingensis]
MPIKYLLVVLCALVIGGGVGYSVSNYRIPKEAKISVSPSPTPYQGNTASPNPVVAISKLQDRDKLLDQLSRVHDSTVGYEYTEDQRKVLQSDPANKDYVHVLQKFVQTQLKKEIGNFQTIGKPQNPRSVLVTTTDQVAYMVTMRKDYTHDGIWLIHACTDYTPGENSVPDFYTRISLAQAPVEVKTWAETILKQPEWKKEYQTFGDRTYALIKSSSSYSDSVELEDVSVSMGEAFIAYQSYQYAAGSDKDLINDYVLLELKGSGIREVNFQNTYSNFSLVDGKEPAPGDASSIVHLTNKIVLNPKFLEIAAAGKISGVEFGIGTAEDEVIARWGKPHEVGTRQVEFQRWHHYQMYFWPPDQRIGAIRVLGAAVDYSLPEVKKALGLPSSEINGEDGVWGLFYRVGEYELRINATTKDGQVESLMLKKKP